MEIQATTYVADLLLGCILGLTIINIVVFFLVSQLGKHHILKMQNELFTQQIGYQSQYTESIKQQHKATIHVQHDIKQSMAVIKTLLKEKNYDKAISLLEEYAIANSLSAVVIRTDNVVLNSIVSQKFTYAHSLGIKTFCALPETFTLLSDVDLCNLLGNMLDNAIDYCSDNPNENNEISTIINFHENRYSILVKNTIHKSVLLDNENLKTTKKHREKHGIGVKTIKKIAKKYDGFFDCYEKDGLFCMKVVLFLGTGDD